jgi:hypothetical protein
MFPPIFAAFGLSLLHLSSFNPRMPNPKLAQNPLLRQTR